MTASKRKNLIDFLRTPAGVKVLGGKYSVHLTFEDILAMNTFIASGARASSTKIEKNYERASLRAVSLRDLEHEIDRRANLRDARLEAAEDIGREADPHAIREIAAELDGAVDE